MRASLNRLLIVALLALSQGSLPLRAEQGEALSPERALIAVYKARGARSGKIKTIKRAVRDVKFFAEKLCLEGELDTILSIIEVESNFRTKLKGPDGKSFGLGQTLSVDDCDWFRFWRKRGVRLKGISDPRTQAAFCVSAYHEKLRAARGNVWSGVRRYNGWFAPSLRYKQEVMLVRASIFKRPAKRGERAPVDCGGRR